eukprot:6469998-Amphidinium_carterae.1
MEGFYNPGFDMGQQPKPTNPVHGLLKSADSFPLHRVPPARPLGVHTQVTSSDLDWREEAGTPGLHQLSLGMSTIANDHRLLRVHLHIGLLKCFENALVAVSQ